MRTQLSFIFVSWLISLLPGILSLDIYNTKQSFCYSDSSCGPTSEKWNGFCQTGKKQSPINIVFPKGSEAPTILLPLKRLNTDHFFIQNNGHTVNVDFSAQSDDARMFPGTGLSNISYRITNVHFHWGNNDSIGSEHQINGKYFSMEMHLVYYNKKYPTKLDAILSGDVNALAVVGFVFIADEETKPSLSLAPIVKNVKKIHEKEILWAKVEEPLDLTPLLPPSGASLYKYKGSLTTPGCNEAVDWFIFGKPIKIAPSDVASFRSQMEDKAHTIEENHRPIQALNERVIEKFKLQRD